jgi:hypothetical protein
MQDKPTTTRECATCGQLAYIRVIVRSREIPTHDEFLYECSMCGRAETIYVARADRQALIGDN